jgi:hypothetical protein
MSEREKKLLGMFAVAGVILLFLWGYKSYTSKSLEIKASRSAAETTLLNAELYLKSRDAVQDEIDWLAEHEPQPEAREQIPTKLQQLASSEATRASMTVKKMDILDTPPADETAANRYGVAQVKFTVTGDEKNLYAWFDRMHSPDDFRVISEIVMSPNREEDHLIDCVVTFDQWFVPLPPEL